MNTAYLLLGSNQGDRPAILQMAIAQLGQTSGTILQCSHLYETAAWGNTEQPHFLNQAVQLQTPLEPLALLEAIQAIEYKLGRQRIEKWGQRTLDIDILFFNEMIISTPDLHVPHPELPNRRFALQPLCEIAPRLRHPGSGLTIQDLLEICQDPLEVFLVGPSTLFPTEKPGAQ